MEMENVPLDQNNMYDMTVGISLQWALFIDKRIWCTVKGLLDDTKCKDPNKIGKKISTESLFNLL